MKTADYAVLAVDGGGTRCRAVLSSETGRVHGYGIGGPANYHSIGAAGATQSLAELLKSLPGRPFSVRCAVFGLAGLDSQEDKQQLTTVVVQALEQADIRTERLLLENDGMMTLVGATGGGNGMLVIAGTGSIACGITEDGQRVRVGGWGCRVGDEGSGYSIGMSALNHVLRAYDGRDSQSGICEAILREKGLGNVEELFAWIYSSSFSTEAVAGLTPLVCRLAEAGDWKAENIIKTAANELCLMASVVIKRLNLEEAAVHTVLTGGVLQQNAQLRRRLEDGIKQLSFRAQFAPARYEPIAGGVLLGLHQLGLVDERILMRVAAEIADRAEIVN